MSGVSWRSSNIFILLILPLAAPHLAAAHSGKFVAGPLVLGPGLHAALDVSLLTNKLLILQVTLILAVVPASLYHLNDCLKNLLREVCEQSLDSKISQTTIRKNIVPKYNTVYSYKSLNTIIYFLGRNEDGINKSSGTTAATINRLRILYVSLCGVVKHINDSHGKVLAVLITCFMILLVIALNSIITSLFGSNKTGLIHIIVQMLWIQIHITDLIMLIEPCHRVYEQIDRTKYLIGQLMLFTPQEHREVIHELELFYRHLISDVVYTPMDIFYLNRTVIFTVIGTITTYLVIIVKL